MYKLKFSFKSSIVVNDGTAVISIYAANERRDSSNTKCADAKASTWPASKALGKFELHLSAHFLLKSCSRESPGAVAFHLLKNLD